MEWGAYSDPVQFVSVIGRGGEQISRIQAESGCKIQIASGKGFFFHGSQFGRNRCFAKFSRFRYLCSLRRGLGAWVSVHDCCFSCISELDSQNRTSKTRAEAGQPIWPLRETLCCAVAQWGPCQHLLP